MITYRVYIACYIATSVSSILNIAFYFLRDWDHIIVVFKGKQHLHMLIQYFLSTCVHIIRFVSSFYIQSKSLTLTVCVLTHTCTYVCTELDNPQSLSHTPLDLDLASLSSAPSSDPSTPDLPNRDRGEASGSRVRDPSTDFALRRTTQLSTPEAPSRNDWVRLNVGGKIFATTR